MVLPDLLAADPFAPSARQAAIIGILAAIVLYAYWYSRRKMTGGKWPKFRHLDLAIENNDVSARKDLAKVVTQLDELSRQVESRLDAKCAALEQSIHNADQRITALSTLLKAARSAGVQLESGGTDCGSASQALSQFRPRRTSSLEPSRGSDAPHLQRLADEGRTASQIAGDTTTRRRNRVDP